MQKAKVIIIATLILTFFDNMFLSYKDNPLPPIRDYPYCLMEVIFGNILDDDVTPTQIDSMFLEPNLYSRAKASAILARGQVVDISKAIEILILELEKEIENPLSWEYTHGFTVPITEILRYEYCVALINLISKEQRGLLYPYIDSASGEVQKRLIISLGYFGDEDVRSQVRDIYLESDNGFLRYRAMAVISRNTDALDLPIIKLALNDDFECENTIDREIIQESALTAFRKLGLTVKKQGDKYIIIEDNK